MSNEKYIGLDVHQATISVAVVDSQGNVVMESILETKGATLLEFLVAVGTTIADRPPHRSARALISACGSYRG